MAKKPTYEELEQRVKELAKEAVERRHAEEEIRTYRSMVESAHDAIFFKDLKSRYVITNAKTLDAFGLSKEKVIGRNDYEIMPTKEEAKKNIEDDQIVFKMGKPKEITKHMTGRDAKEYWFQAIKVPQFDHKGNIVGLVGIARDVTEQKRAEEALLESEQRFRSLVETTSDWVWEVDQNAIYTYASPKVKDQLGYGPQEVIGKTPFDFMPEGEAERIRKFFNEKAINKEPFYGLENVNRHKDGHLVVLETNGIPIFDEKGQLKGYRGIDRDISDRKRAEEEKRRLEAQLQQARKLEAVGTLAGGIAHDFNNVLMGIQGHSSLALLYADSGRPHSEHLKGIEDMVQRGAALTKQLLGFAMGGKYEVRPTDLNELIEDSSEMFGRTKKEIKIHRKYQKDIRPVEADRGQIDQVLLNLYVNAWHAMPRGGDLYVETSSVVLDENHTRPFGVKPGNYVRISVTDTGVGMDEATQQRIFDPFFTTKEMGRGTGLGLASAYGIIKNHGGIMNVYSKKGEGTTFNVYLPASEKEVTIREKKLADEILSGTETVLIVDDEDMILDVGEEMLKEMGYKVLLARSGKEAVELYRKYKHEIDLVILDMIMPNMGGGEAYDTMKENNPKIKVLLSTGYSIRGQATEILERGCNGFIQKPFKIKELSRKIREILDKQ